MSFKRYTVAALLASTLLSIPLVAQAIEGRFVKGTGAAVYIHSGGTKRHIINPTCYVAAGGKADFSDTKIISDKELALIPEAAPIMCEKAFVKFPDDATVYMVQGGLLRPLLNPDCAFSHGVAKDWSNIVTIPARWQRSYGYGAMLCK